MNIETSPVIVLGMHRSGTSLLSIIVEHHGIYMGNVKDKHNESEFFKSVNEMILKRSHGYWDYPLPVKELVSNDSHKRICLNRMKQRFNSFDFYKNYVGIRRCFNKSKLNMWGWKDPRTVATLPLWISLFPDAKIIYIHRSAFEVAISLNKRERERKEINSDISSARCMSLDNCYMLCQEYSQLYKFNKTQLPKKVKDNLLEISYEQLLKNESKSIKMINQFLGVDELNIDSKLVDKEYENKYSNTEEYKYLSRKYTKEYIH